jgi:hypothetical protein
MWTGGALPKAAFSTPPGLFWGRVSGKVLPVFWCGTNPVPAARPMQAAQHHLSPPLTPREYAPPLHVEGSPGLRCGETDGTLTLLVSCALMRDVIMALRRHGLGTTSI